MPFSTTIRKDGKAYDSGDVELVIAGQLEDEVSEITYSTDQEHQRNFSLKNDATSYSMGKKNHNATVTLYMAAAVRIEKKSGGDLLAMKPFDINVTYTNDDNEIVNDTLTVKFQDQGREVTGEMGLKRQYSLFVLDIKYLNS